jgi:hypothetical protein
MEHFYQKKEFTKPYISQNVHLLNTFEVMVEKPILTNPLGEWRHLVKKFEKFFHNFFPFSTRTRCKKPIEKKNH